MTPFVRILGPWTSRMIVVAILSLGLLEAVPVLAQENGDGIVRGRPRRADALEFITIDVREKDLREVLQGIGRQVDVNIVADPEVDEKVTVSLDSVEWRKALEIIARQTNCTIVRESARLIRFAQPPSINIEFQDADLKIVLDLLAKQSGANIVVAEQVTGKVSLSLRNVPWREALDTIVKTAGYVMVEGASDGVTDIIRVVSPEDLTKQLETEVIQLRFVRPPEPYIAKIADVQKHTFDSRGDEVSVDPEAEFTLLTALRKALSEDGEMDYDINTNTLIVKDVRPRLDDIRDLISEMDVEQPLVKVDVKFLSTSNDDILETGLKFDLPDTPAREGLRINGFFPESTDIVTARELFNGVLNPVVGRGGTYPFDLGRFETLRSGFTALGILDFTQTRVLLSMIRDDDNSRIIQEPTLTTLSNVPSTIFVGEAVPFAVQRVQQDQNGNLTVEIDENERSPVNIGFTLYVSPHVIPGTDTIHLNVIPKVSTLTGTTSVIEGFDRFSFSEPGSSLTTFIDLPREASQTVVTNLRVESGHTAVIGGLHTERRVEITTKIPLLSSIPVAGNIFTWKRKAATVDHLLILISPTVMTTTQMMDEAYYEAAARQLKNDYFARKYETKDEESSDEESGDGEDPRN